ncbi:MAG: SUMF1/EgtB/PvdO family nonheme iron enzyme [Planctomycetota bacterium]
MLQPLVVLVASCGLAAPSSFGQELKIVPAKSVPIPGLVEVTGGRTTIGSSEKEIEALLEQQPGFVRVLDAQTPQHTMEVGTFWMGVYEVTNAEYLTFVEATGHQAPLHWANEKALAQAAADFAKGEQEKFDAAKQEGRRYEKRGWAAGDGLTPRDRWWAENWREAGYAIPEGQERFPVVMVAYADAVAYCEWAGLRLPTEFEFQRAARKDSKSAYPWGDDWEDGKYCVSNEMRRSKPYPVGSFAAGVSPFGIHDLAGNVWEWTSSPYKEYKGFKPGEYTVKINGKRERKSALPVFDPNQRVAMSGAFENDKLAARIATRRGTERTQFTGGMGFRVAASPRVCEDKATLVLENVIQNSAARGDGVAFDMSGVVGIDRWQTGATGISGYDFMLFAPVALIEESQKTDLEVKSRVHPAQLGFFSTDIELLEPALPAGDYIVAYRAKGRAPRIETPKDDKKDDKGKDKGKGEAEQEPEPMTDPAFEGLDVSDSWLLFIRPSDGTRAAEIKLSSDLNWTTSKGTPAGTISARLEKVRVGSGATAVIEPQNFLDFKIGLIGKLRSQVMWLEFAVRPSAAALGAPWRQ